MRFHSYLNTAALIIEGYDGSIPLAHWLKEFFQANKKHGSKDRKQIAHLCYSYFRLGKSFLQVPISERILMGLFLCSNDSNKILEKLKPEWNEQAKQITTEKFSMLISAEAGTSPVLNVFPWKEQLSEAVDHAQFCQSFFTQPDLFLRIRPGFENIVREKLLDSEINFKEIAAECLALPNASKIEEILEVDKEVVIQDYSSQRVGDLFKSARQNSTFKISVWDCCAASGGKSLLLYDINQNIDLTVSDVRQSILVNLKKRFQKAGIKKYNSFVVDLTQRNLEHGTSPKGVLRTNFDLIICDVPCTGSGTWSRTPEQLYFFDEKKIDHYASLQEKIVLNVSARLKQNGYLIYITCSVFKKENEEQIDRVIRDLNLELVKMELVKGYDKKADTMFVAMMRKS